MRTCIFCLTPLSSTNRAKEHVLRHSWLRKLGHKKTGIALGKHSKHGFIAEQRLAADQLLTGEVCVNCNNGWMDYLDRRVEHIVLGLAKTPDKDVHLSKQDAKTVGRWLLKTACCFIHTDSPERRHIPRSILTNIRREGYLPPGFVAFSARSSFPTKGVGAAHLDMWLEAFAGDIARLPQTSRLKFGIQYDNVLLGCSYVNCATPVFTGIAGFHHPFVESRAKFALRAPPLGKPNEWIKFPDEVDNTILNLFLLLVGVKDSKNS